MGLVTARFLWRNIKYAILIIFIVAAVLTPSADPYNQMIFAAPMIGLYLISIGIAWIVGPKRGRAASSGAQSNGAPLIFAAAASIRPAGEVGVRRIARPTGSSRVAQLPTEPG